MKRDPIDTVIRLAFLEASITTHGAYEKTVARRIPRRKADEDSRVRLLARLEAVLEHRLAAGEIPLTVGSFLRDRRKSGVLKPEELYSRLGISRNIYRMLERDRISPLKLSAVTWRRFRDLFQLPLEAMLEMIRRTHQLVFFRPAFRMTLARYDARKSRAMKAATLEKAATELFTRASLPLPAEEQAKIDTLLRSIEEEPAA